MPDLPPPTEYFDLNVGLVELPPEGSFGLSVENRTGEPWAGRIPVVWVQSGVSWVEVLDVRLGPHEARRMGLRTRWTETGGPLECRLPLERSPRDLLSLPDGKISEWALGSNYLPLGRLSIPISTPPPTAAQERKDRIRQALWLVFAAVLGIVAVVLILYATAVF